MRYSGDHITSVQAIPSLDKTSSKPLELSRQALMEEITAGKRVVTLHRQSDGKWAQLDSAKIIAVKGAPFIKLFDDHQALDDLGDLLEY